MKRILIIGSQHGNELLGELLYAYIKKQPTVPELLVDYYLANPQARKQHVRYLESDMNRSYTGATTTYEERSAQILLSSFKDRQYDLIIDAHTTTVSQAPCIIVPDITPAIARYLRATHIKNIVLMRHEFVTRSLIGNLPNAVSIEVSNDQLSDRLYGKLYQGLVDFALCRGSFPSKHIFEVDDVIAKASLTPKAVATLQNFQRSEGGFYPVLVGENSYKRQTNYLGFRAAAKERIIIQSSNEMLIKDQL